MYSVCVPTTLIQPDAEVVSDCVHIDDDSVFS